MSKLTQIGVLFSAKLLAVYGAGVGLICGTVYSFGGFIYELFATRLNSGTALAFLALLGMPILLQVKENYLRSHLLFLEFHYLHYQQVFLVPVSLAQCKSIDCTKYVPSVGGY